MQGDWNYPTRVRFGAGRMKEIASVLAEAGIERPLIVTDPGLAGLPMLAELSRHCENASRGAICFTDSSPNPVGADVDAARWLVEQQDIGFAIEPTGNQDLLLVAAAQLLYVLLHRVTLNRQSLPKMFAA